MKYTKKTAESISKLHNNYKIWLMYVIIIFASLIVFLCMYLETARINESKATEMMIKYPPYSFDGSTYVTETYPIMRQVVFVGDSYTHFLSLDLGFDTVSFSRPGYTIEMLDESFKEAFETKRKYLVVFVGPNDFNKGNTPEQMYNALRKSIYEFKYKVNGTVILCTYLPSIHTNRMEKQFPNIPTIKEFNDQILRLVDEKNRIYYLDLSDTANKKEYYKYNEKGELDTVHFNYAFNINFINKLYSLMIRIVRNGH